jgi:transcription termination/antitermination protein NusG
MTTQTTVPASAQWFAIHTLSGQEGKVKSYIEKFKTVEELDEFIFEVLLPTEVVSEVKNGKKSTKTRKLYPGYIFIQMKMYDEDKRVINKPWYFVKEVAGVIGFVGSDHPAPLRQAEIDEIKARIEAANGKEVPKVSYEVGEEVKVNDGALPISPAVSTRLILLAVSLRFPYPSSAVSPRLNWNTGRCNV